MKNLLLPPFYIFSTKRGIAFFVFLLLLSPSLIAQYQCDDLLDARSGYAEYVNVTGGAGESIYIVQNTNADGPGSYKDALSQGDRYIIFHPSLSNQRIELAEELIVSESNITLDGREAPGLEIGDNATKFEGTNYIVAYMNYHDLNAMVDTTDGITFRNAPSGGQKFFVYKCSFDKIADGAIDVIWNRGNDVYGTISHCKFQYIDKTILHHAGDPDDEGGTYYLTFNYNWFYKTGQRNPFGRDGYVHYYNNLIEHWGGIDNDGQGAYAGENSSYLIENNIAIEASPGDTNWSGATIITPKLKVFAPAYLSPTEGGTANGFDPTASVKLVNNRVIAPAIEIARNPQLVSDPPYDYELETAINNPNLELYIRDNANSDYESDCCTYVDIDFSHFDIGWGSMWNDGGNNCRKSNYSSYVYSGNYCVRLRDDTNSSTMTTDNLNLTNYDELKVSFTYVAVGMDDASEDFWLQISTNGGLTYNNVDEWNLGDEFENLIREFDEIRIPGPFTANTKLRFRCDASHKYDRVYIDDVRIRGCLNTSSQ